MTDSAAIAFSSLHARTGVAEAAAATPAPAERFSEQLREAARTGRRDQLRDAVSQLVSTALVEPVLSSLRESPFLTGPFAPGDAERRFGPLLDQQIADRVVTAANFPMIDTMVERYWRQATSPAEQVPKSDALKEHVDASA